jgi:TetR/AcrR family transcriptional regulator, cholesterol catabolism regulator
MLTAMMKETIFEAASSVLCSHGVSGTTMNRVAEAANVAKSSLYDYFESKEDLLRFFRERLVEPFLHAIEEIAAGNLPAAQKLEAILRVSWERSVNHKCLIRLLAEADQHQEIKKQVRPRLLGVFTSVFERGVEEGTFRAHNCVYTGRLFLGCLTELFELQTDDASSDEVKGYVEVLIDAVLNGFSIHAEKKPV